MDGYENKVPDAWKPWISFESFPTLYLLVKMPGRYGPYCNTVCICLKALLRLCIYMLGEQEREREREGWMGGGGL
jgi:hypothetical protein